MPEARRPISLTIPITSIPLWHVVRPPTPRRATYPFTSNIARLDDNPPPVPPLSYWDPDTPSPCASRAFPSTPMSPMNPFLIPPHQFTTDMYAHFPKASLLLPASPLSIFEKVLSPTAPAPSLLRSCRLNSAKKTFLFPASPLSPRFMCPRTPPPCPNTPTRKASVYDVVMNMAERKGSVASMVRMKEAMRLEFYQSLLLKKQIQMNEHQRAMYKKEGTGWKLKGVWKRLFGQKTKSRDR